MKILRHRKYMSYTVLLARALHISSDELLCFKYQSNELEFVWQETLKTILLNFKTIVLTLFSTYSNSND